MSEANTEIEEVAAEEINAEVDVEKTAPKEENEFKAKYYYLAAEFENARKRFEREKENLLKYGSEKILSGLVGVLDNFDLTTSALQNDEDEKIQNIAKGIAMVRNQFLDILKNNGMTTVESIGKKFDPNFHEAVAQAPAPEKEDQEILTEYQKGYLLNGRLLRAAKVVVAKNN